MKILFVQNRILFPTNTGGRIRTLNVLRHLAKWHDITYLCNVENGDKPHLEQMKQLGVTLETCQWKGTKPDQWKFYWGLATNCCCSLPFSVSKDNNPLLRRRAEQLTAGSPFDLVICDFVQMLPATIGLPCRASILFQHNVEAQILQRHAETDRGWLRRRVMSMQWKKMRRFEQQSGRQFDAVIAVSDEDRATFKNQYDWDNVQVIDTAVNVDYFQPRQQVDDNVNITFVASMDWLPNQEGAIWFAREVWPLILAEYPKARFRLVGRNPSRKVESLAAEQGVEVLGTVPDVRPHLADAAVIVVPLLVGGGTRIKIFEAMAMGKAVVSTTIGAEGLKVTAGKHILLADSASDFARATSRLLANSAQRKQMGDAAHQLVNENFSAESVARQFEQICQQAVDSKPPVK
ncbi:MAG: glycosyltransferase family 4 protein [Planctomycetales bacterium]